MRKSISLALFSFLLAASVALAKTDKTVVCHVPPGNPGNAHTISVADRAVASHLAHGDCLGACTVCGCGFSDTVLCGGKCHLCVDLSRTCSLSAVSCCPPCQCPPGDEVCCEENPRCCGGPEGPECQGAAAGVTPEDCGHVVCVE
jgi:hypothetical protein